MHLGDCRAINVALLRAIPHMPLCNTLFAGAGYHVETCVTRLTFHLHLDRVQLQAQGKLVSAEIPSKAVLGEHALHPLALKTSKFQSFAQGIDRVINRASESMKEMTNLIMSVWDAHLDPVPRQAMRHSKLHACSMGK